MSQIQVITLSPGDAVTSSIRVDLSRFRNGVGLLVTIDQGATATYTVQVSGDGVHWNSHDVLFNKSASANDSIAYPVTAVRLTVTSYTSGSVTLGIAQWP